MAGFSGFTEEDIRRFKMQGGTTDFDDNARQEPIKKAAMNPSGKRSRPREKVRTKSSNSKSNGKANADPEKKPVKKEEPVEAEDQHEEIVAAEKKVEEKPREIEVVMEPERVKELELSNLEKMQQKQKEMEEINKKKEKMLQSALKQRYAKTKKETETLQLVQKELSRLDNLLYTDVQILRDKIDQACREFDDARKRYSRAETEFINAKVNLHDKTETKDQLTEHLCSIIQQNEERKAKKLAELMAKLELADQEMNVEIDGKNSEKLEEDSSTASVGTKTKDCTILQENMHQTDAKELPEPDRKSNETNSLKQDNNNEKNEIGQNVTQKNEPELDEGKKTNDALEKT